LRISLIDSSECERDLYCVLIERSESTLFDLPDPKVGDDET